MALRIHVPIVHEGDEFLFSPISDNRVSRHEQYDFEPDVPAPVAFEIFLTVLLFLVGCSPALALVVFYATR